MNYNILGWGIGLLIAALIFMVRADVIGYVGGGIIGAIGLIMVVVGLKTG